MKAIGRDGHRLWEFLGHGWLYGSSKHALEAQYGVGSVGKYVSGMDLFENY